MKDFLVAEAIAERSTPRMKIDLEDSDGVPLDPTDVISGTLTLKDIATGNIVNGRDDVDIVNVNGGTIETGLFTFQLTEEDTAILGTGNVERKRLTLDLRLAGGGRFTERVRFYVSNLEDIE